MPYLHTYFFRSQLARWLGYLVLAACLGSALLALSIQLGWVEKPAPKIQRPGSLGSEPGRQIHEGTTEGR